MSGNEKLVQSGTVLRGGGAARLFGFPTANIACNQTRLSGTFAGTVAVRGTTYHAAIYIDPKRGLWEAYLFDFAGDLYDEEVEMTLLELVEPAILYTPETDIESFIRGAIRKAKIFFETR